MFQSGEEVPVEYKVKAYLRLGHHQTKMEVYVESIIDDCILGKDFFNITGLAEDKI